MAMSLFTKAILEDRPIEVFNHGKMQRDFTYIDDIVEGVVRVLDKIPVRDPSFDRTAPDAASSDAPYRLYNIGNDTPVELMMFIETIEKAVGKKAIINMLPMQAGDVSATHADIADLHGAIGFAPRTPLKDGVERSVAWFKDYHGVVKSQEGVAKVAVS